MIHKFEIKPKPEYMESFYSCMSADFLPGQKTFDRALYYIENIDSVGIDDICSAFIGSPTTSLVVTVTSPNAQGQVYQAIQKKLDVCDGRFAVLLVQHQKSRVEVSPGTPF